MKIKIEEKKYGLFDLKKVCRYKNMEKGYRSAHKEKNRCIIQSLFSNATGFYQNLRTINICIVYYTLARWAVVRNTRA